MPNKVPIRMRLNPTFLEVCGCQVTSRNAECYAALDSLPPQEPNCGPWEGSQPPQPSAGGTSTSLVLCGDRPSDSRPSIVEQAEPLLAVALISATSQ